MTWGFYARAVVLECAVLAAVLIVGTDLSAMKIITLTIAFPLATAVATAVMYLALHFTRPKCPECGARHAPHDEESDADR